ncbi:MAG: hypothetical protein DRJ33_05190 [Candidatus Methanomethylicota archaeon]|uniref:Type II secretion system protein GspF domain-containing protein n=1 Tax=Thermoproteota archaeon TaxID=2056631 RepID=A0A497EXL0_9CREN|nr:MAG: hypothetical protein DRJ33_05190 [Candidatus Verstraetearchaeota archaeon]
MFSSSSFIYLIESIYALMSCRPKLELMVAIAISITALLLLHHNKEFINRSSMIKSIRMRVESYKKACHSIELSGNVKLKINNLGMLFEATLYLFMLLTFTVLLSDLWLLEILAISLCIYAIIDRLDKALFKPPPPEYRRISKRWYVSFVVNHARLRNLALRIENMIKDELESAGLYVSGFNYACKIVVLLFTAILFSLFSICTLKITFFNITENPSMLLLCFMPLLLPLIPLLSLKMKKGDRRRGVEEELPYLALYASIAQGMGIPLYESIRKLAHTGLFPYLTKESLIIDRNINLIGMDPATAMIRTIRKHPSRKFKDLVYGYTSILKSGGDLCRYLEECAKNLLSDLKFRWKLYADQATNIGESLTIIFLMSTIVIVAGSMIMPINTVELLVKYNYFILPAMTITSYSLIHLIQPKIKDSFKPKLTQLILAFIPTSLTCYILIIEPWVKTLLCLLCLSIAVYVPYYKYSREVYGIDSSLEDFLRDIIEMRKIGYSVSKAILYISSQRNYNKSLDSLIKALSSIIRVKGSLIDAYKTAKSWLSKFTLWVLNEVELIGNAPPITLEELISFIRGVNEARREAKKLFTLYEVLVYVTPFFLALVVTGSYYMLVVYSLTLSKATSILGFPTISVPPALLSEAKMSIILSTFALSVLASKTINFTVANTLRCGVSMLLTLIAIPTSETLLKLLFSF